MARVGNSIVVDVPVRTAYNQWTQFEEFPRFVDSEITEQVPGRVIAWRSLGGSETAGRVTFEPIDEARTQITLELDYNPEGLLENAGDMLGITSRLIECDLERLKEYVERRGPETGAMDTGDTRKTPEGQSDFTGAAAGNAQVSEGLSSPAKTEEKGRSKQAAARGRR